MTIRKRKNPTPHYRLPPPYNPITGEYAKLMTPGIHPYCALVEVAAADTHDDYLICRGYDTRDRKFYDYDLDEGKPGLPVAKPFGKRTAMLYLVGEVYPAFLPQSLIGQASGTVNGTDLLDLEILKTDDGEYINWMLVEGKAIVRFELGDNLTAIGGGSSESVVVHEIGGSLDGDDDMPVTVYDAYGQFYARGASGALQGCLGYAMWVADMARWEIVAMEKNVWMGVLDDQLVPYGGASATVSLWWPNDTTGVMEDSALNVEAEDWLLPAGTALAAGEKVILRYDSQNAKWWVINGEAAFGA